MSNVSRWTVFASATFPLLLLGIAGCSGYRRNVCQPVPPCIGPDLAFYGHKKTCWQLWPNLEWSQWPCPGAVQEELPVQSEEVVSPREVQVEPAAFWQSTSADRSDQTVNPPPSVSPRRLPPQLIHFDATQLLIQ